MDVTVTCQQVGCHNVAQPITVPVPDDGSAWTVTCGPCGAVLAVSDDG